MQLLAKVGREFGTTRAGLDRRRGGQAPAQHPALKIPHMGWNDLIVSQADPISDDIGVARRFIYPFL